MKNFDTQYEQTMSILGNALNVAAKSLPNNSNIQEVKRSINHAINKLEEDRKIMLRKQKPAQEEQGKQWLYNNMSKYTPSAQSSQVSFAQEGTMGAYYTKLQAMIKEEERKLKELQDKKQPSKMPENLND